MSNEALLCGLQQLRRQLDALEALVQPEVGDWGGPSLSTTEAARVIGISTEALTRWARTHPAGATRDGFRAVLQEGGRRLVWRWIPVDSGSGPLRAP